jgi:tetratricopeptide (TPR) repeat protein
LKINSLAFNFIILSILFQAGCGYKYISVPFRNAGKSIKASEDKFFLKKNKKKFILFSKRYLVIIQNNSPLGQINNKGIDLCRKKRYLESEIIFLDAIFEFPLDPVVYNNLGVLYELNRNEDSAFQMYSKACILAKDNLYFRENFLLLISRKKKE